MCQLKIHFHEIFYIGFFHQKNPPDPLIHTLNSFWKEIKFAKIFYNTEHHHVKKQVALGLAWEIPLGSLANPSQNQIWW